MRAISTVLVLSLVMVSAVGRADEADAGAKLSPEEKAAEIAKLCVSSRVLRVTDAQKYARAWVERLGVIKKAGCYVVRKGDMHKEGQHVLFEHSDHPVCPKGPPGDETLETVYSVLVVADPADPPSASPTEDSKALALDEACRDQDTAAGLNLFPASNDPQALAKLLAWRAPTKK